jgi:hypothetical protein
MIVAATRTAAHLTSRKRSDAFKVVELLQSMEFPALHGDHHIDDIINNCWNNKYTTFLQLAIQTQLLSSERINMTHFNSRGKDESREATAISQPWFTAAWYGLMNRFFHAVNYEMGKWWTLLLRYVKGEVTKSK